MTGTKAKTPPHFLTLISGPTVKDIGPVLFAPAKSAAAVEREMLGHKYYYSGSVWVVLAPLFYATFEEKLEAEEFITSLTTCSYGDFTPRQCTEEVDVEYYTVEFAGFSGEGVEKERNINLAAYTAEYIDHLEESNRRPEYSFGHSFMKYNNKTNVFLASRVATTVTCGITGRGLTAADRTTTSMYNSKDFFTSNAILSKLGSMRVFDLNTSVSKFDPNIPSTITLGDGTIITKGFVEENPDQFFTSPLSETIARKAVAVTLHSGLVVSKEDFSKFGFICKISQEKHLLKDNPRSGHRGIADAHYVPKFTEVLRPRESDPLNIFGHVNRSGELIPGQIPAKKGDKKNRDLYLSMEIEVFGKDEIASAKTIVDIEAKRLGICVSDGSLPRNGFEVKTIPTYKSFPADKIDELVGIFQKNKIDANEKCGVHIHVSRAALSELQVDRIMSFVYSYGNRLLIEKVAGRAANEENVREYCKYDRAKDRLSVNVRYGKNQIKKDSDKYCAVNAHKEYTIEFRLFAGTVDPDRLKMYTDFVRALIEFTSAGVCNTPYKEAARTRDFLAFLLDVKSNRRKEYPHLINFLVGEKFLDRKSRSEKSSSSSTPIAQA